MRFAAILFVLTSCSGILCDVITTTNAPKTDFVDVLKRNLRRNNDDYIESTTLSVNVPNPYLLQTTEYVPNNTIKSNQTLTKQGTFNYQRGPSSNKLFIDIKSYDAAHRRVFDSLDSRSAEDKELTVNQSKSETTTIPHNVTLSTTLKVTTTQPQEPKLSSATLQISTLKMAVKKLNRSALTAGPNFRSSKLKGRNESVKFGKIKNFIARNKQLFEDFLKKKKMDEAKKAKAANNIQRPRKTSDSESESEAGNRYARLLQTRARPVELAIPAVRPEELDMAHAKGGQIHALRIKDRLCYRHVLIPEGPKYDSHGNQYVPAYGHHRGRNFSRTRPPSYLLPRCCNCCKKSLLGCE